MIQDIDAAGLAKLLNESKTPVLIDFYADWCGPCKQLAPAIDKIAAAYNGKLAVVKIDLGRNNGVQITYCVGRLPNVLLYYQGKEAGRIAGYQGEAALRKAIDGLLAKI